MRLWIFDPAEPRRRQIGAAYGRDARRILHDSMIEERRILPPGGACAAATAIEPIGAAYAYATLIAP